MFLSIIIPVYNVEQYLQTCLDSCINQDIPSSEYEIICVDDGSPDNCGSIIDEYSKKYQNIIAIHKPNGGLSSARNAGLDVAQGDYIWFIDSDDTILENCLSGIKDFILSKDSPIIRLRAITFYDSDNIEHIKSKNITNHNIEKLNMICFFIIKNEIINKNKIRFEESIKFAEDAMFIIRLSPFIPIIDSTPIYNNCISYYYRQREGSLIRSSKEKKADARLKMLPILKQYINDGVDPHECLYMIYNNVAYIMGYCSELPKNSADEKAEYLKSLGYYPLKLSKKYMSHSTKKGERIAKRITHILNDYSYTRTGYFFARIWHKIKK